MQKVDVSELETVCLYYEEILAKSQDVANTFVFSSWSLAPAAWVGPDLVGKTVAVTLSVCMVPDVPDAAAVCPQTHQVAYPPLTLVEFGQQRGESNCCSKKSLLAFQVSGFMIGAASIRPMPRQGQLAYFAFYFKSD